MDILNIGAGRLLYPLDLGTPSLDFKVYCLDPWYKTLKHKYIPDNIVVIAEDAKVFLEDTNRTFDQVCMYRFLEHVPQKEIPYFIYLLSQVMKKGSFIDVIVPDFEELCKLFLLYNNQPTDNFDLSSNDFITIVTEVLNEPSLEYPNSSHSSIWSEKLLVKYFQEERFFISTFLQKGFKLDNRDIYIRAKFERL